MRITEDYSEFQIELIAVKTAKYIGDFAIRINFSDGFHSLVDFKPFLESSVHPSIRKYLDERRFKQFQIVDGNLNWNNHDLIFPIEDLYQGKL